MKPHVLGTQTEGGRYAFGGVALLLLFSSAVLPAGNLIVVPSSANPLPICVPLNLTLGSPSSPTTSGAGGDPAPAGNETRSTENETSNDATNETSTGEAGNASTPPDETTVPLSSGLPQQVCTPYLCQDGSVGVGFEDVAVCVDVALCPDGTVGIVVNFKEFCVDPDDVCNPPTDSAADSTGCVELCPAGTVGVARIGSLNGPCVPVDDPCAPPVEATVPASSGCFEPCPPGTVGVARVGNFNGFCVTVPLCPFPTVGVKPVCVTPPGGVPIPAPGVACAQDPTTQYDAGWQPTPGELAILALGNCGFPGVMDEPTGVMPDQTAMKASELLLEDVGGPFLLGDPGGGNPLCGTRDGDHACRVYLVHGYPGANVGSHEVSNAFFEPLKDRLESAGYTVTRVGYYGGECFTEPFGGMANYGPSKGEFQGRNSHSLWFPSSHTSGSAGCDGVASSQSHTKETNLYHLAFHLSWGLYENGSRDCELDPTDTSKYFDVVTHSMGGLLLRIALMKVQQKDPAWPPALCVEDVVTLSGPHDGINGACAAMWSHSADTEVRQMCTWSSTMKDVRANGNHPQGVPSLTRWNLIGSHYDCVVRDGSATKMDAETALSYWFRGTSANRCWSNANDLPCHEYGHSGYFGAEGQGSTADSCFILRTDTAASSASWVFYDNTYRPLEMATRLLMRADARNP